MTTLLQLQMLRAAPQVRFSLLHRSHLCRGNSVQLHLLHLCVLHCFLQCRTCSSVLAAAKVMPCCTAPSQQCDLLWALMTTWSAHCRAG